MYSKHSQSAIFSAESPEPQLCRPARRIALVYTSLRICPKILIIVLEIFK